MTTYILENEEDIDQLKKLLMKELEKGKRIAVSDAMASFNAPTKRKKSFRFENYYTPDIFGEQETVHVPTNDLVVLGIVSSSKIKGKEDKK